MADMNIEPIQVRQENGTAYLDAPFPKRAAIALELLAQYDWPCVDIIDGLIVFKFINGSGRYRLAPKEAQTGYGLVIDLVEEPQ